MAALGTATLEPRYVASVVAAALRDDVAHVEPVRLGYGNDNWQAVTSGGRKALAKFGPLASVEKWRSAARASLLAAGASVPVPRLLHFDVHDGRLLRVFEWIDGQKPDPQTMDATMVATLFRSLGTAVASLHSVPMPTFSSRVDNSAPAFPNWRDYLAYRLAQVLSRCRECDALDELTVNRLSARVTRLAPLVSPSAVATLVHRDLYADNLLIGTDGGLVAVLDFDMAEVWDSAGEWFKLSWVLFPGFPGGEDHFTAAYRMHHPAAELWEARRHVVDVIEAANTVPNAVLGGQPSFEASARRYLAELLDTGPALD